MKWMQVRLDTRAELAEKAEAALLAQGAAAVTLQDNADEPLFAQAEQADPLWRETCISGLFPADFDIDGLRQVLPADLRHNLRAEILEDKDWAREWQQYYAPLQITERLWLCPSWHTPPDPAALNVMLDPGLAFGTGTHPTTSMCLRQLAELTPPGAEVVDFGCGSGVLGITALLLGAARVLATDTDPQALTATWANAERNGIEAERLQLCLPSALTGNERADLVVANILAQPLCQLAPTLCAMLRPGATLLLSGLLAEQVDMLRQHYPLALEIAEEREGWVVLRGQASR